MRKEKLSLTDYIFFFLLSVIVVTLMVTSFSTYHVPVMLTAISVANTTRCIVKSDNPFLSNSVNTSTTEEDNL